MENIENFEIIEDFRQSEEYANYLQTIGWRVIKIQDTRNKIQIFVKSFGFWGICKIQRYQNEIDFEKLEHILKTQHVCRIILEPEINGKALPNFKINNEPLLGTKTLRVNLNQSENDLFKSFQKDCRYNIRKLQDTSYKKQINLFGQFYEIWKKSGKRLNIWIPSKNEFEDFVKCFGEKIFCITIDDKAGPACRQAGCIVVIHKKTAFYYYAGATKEGTRENLPYLVVWTAMKEARKRGAKVWDFEGIYDARWPDKRWLGFSHFKKSFGGREIEFLGSFAKWRWPF